jgi:hypothetical protein
MSVLWSKKHNDPTSARSILRSPESLLGTRYDATRKYILATSLGVAQRTNEGYVVDLEGVEGAVGEKFVLMSRKES